MVDPRRQLASKIAEKKVKKKPLLLMFHPGGFILGDKNSIGDQTLQAAKQDGFKARSVEYPLADPRGAWREAKRKAKKAEAHGRKVYSYGESAGGALAIRLAQAGLAKKAGAMSPLTNLVNYSNKQQALPGNQDINVDSLLGGSERVQRQVSPVYHKTRRSNPVFETIGREETSWFGDDARAYGKQRNVTLREVPGDHLGAIVGDPAAGQENYRHISDMILRWLSRRNRR